MSVLNDGQLAELRIALHGAQSELAPICRDAIYGSDKLRALIYDVLPTLYGQLERDTRQWLS